MRRRRNGSTLFRMRRVGYNVECGVLNVEWVLWMLND